MSAKKDSSKKSDVKKTNSAGAAKSSSGNKGRKPTIHPNYRLITVRETDGTEFSIRSTYPGDVLKLDIDKKTHPAWTKEFNQANSKDSDVAKFNNKFGDLGI